jgi:biopolymer transport protein ExbB/TolQ
MAAERARKKLLSKRFLVECHRDTFIEEIHQMKEHIEEIGINLSERVLEVRSVFEGLLREVKDRQTFLETEAKREYDDQRRELKERLDFLQSKLASADKVLVQLDSNGEVATCIDTRLLGKFN